MEKRIRLFKRGMSNDLFFNVFGLVLAIIVIIAIFSFIRDVSEQTIFEKNYFARDISLLINTIYSAPGDVVYDYADDKEDFIVEIEEGKVFVFSEGEDKEDRIFYFFGEDTNFDIDENKFSYLGKPIKLSFRNQRGMEPERLETDGAGSFIK
jgi:hypothetical protein